MKIAYLAAGAAGMYCGSCLHDNTLASELLRQGKDVTLVPIYTPIRTDEEDVSLNRVFFGGINAYLQQKWKLFRHTPRWLDAVLDHPAILRFVSGRANSVDPAQLGEMTVSMLRGEKGNQHKELVKLIDWLLAEVQPDVVHLSNSMMIGLASQIAQHCGPPVVCSLSGEDLFLEGLVEPYYTEARELLRERASQVEAFVALNEYYADFMSDYLDVARQKVHVVPHGLNLEGHMAREMPPQHTPVRIGYLARICADKGLHQLIEACEVIKATANAPAFELQAAGYLGAGDRAYWQELEQRILSGPLASTFRYHGEISRVEKIQFLQSSDIFCTPTVYRESKGLPALEALANAVPVVLPDHGSFPELVQKTQGGRLFEPHNVQDLAEQLLSLLTDRSAAHQLGLQGHEVVSREYTASLMAERTFTIYAQLLQTDSAECS